MVMPKSSQIPSSDASKSMFAGEIPSVGCWNPNCSWFNPFQSLVAPWTHRLPSPEVWAMKRRVAPSGAQVPMGGLAPPNQQDMQTTLLTEPQGMGRWSPWHETQGGYTGVVMRFHGSKRWKRSKPMKWLSLGEWTSRDDGIMGWWDDRHRKNNHNYQIQQLRIMFSTLGICPTGHQSIGNLW